MDSIHAVVVKLPFSLLSQLWSLHALAHWDWQRQRPHGRDWYGARFGLLVKGIEALERSHATTTLVVDKTGTLTTGKPKVSHIEFIDGEVREILSIAASLEHGSAHPLADAIITAWSNVTNKRPDLTDIQHVGGMGITGDMEGELVAIGNEPLMEQCDVDLTEYQDMIQQAARKA